MPRLTVTISDEHERILEEQTDSSEAFRSKSEVVRECIESYERVEELSNQMACLEAEVEMLREQRTELKRKAARVEELEEKLRKLQMEYHTLISEGKSPTELEPKLDTTLEIEPGPAVPKEESEPAESAAATEQTEPSTGSTPADATAEATDTTVDSTVAEASGPETGSSEVSVPAAGARPDDGATAGANSKAVARRTTGASEGTDATTPDSGGVEIDEELLYQSPGVGARLKSALFGGPGGSR
jgi:Arc/MetJ-type ribon-helix-helix transcriptional regulator